MYEDIVGIRIRDRICVRRRSGEVFEGVRCSLLWHYGGIEYIKVSVMSL